ncbi:MAG TPA: helix-turn-helix domain-containing protein [Candidatus Acidoferrum sp.]|nr:helix-turn-helix domain-containing protein [Candidatus Acidoferrum sp.]
MAQAASGTAALSAPLSSALLPKPPAPKAAPNAGSVDGAAVCPIAAMLESLARPWTLQILWVLSTNGPTRFGALRRGVAGISSRVLAERLRSLEEKGFVYRDYKPTIPPEVTYGITSRMKDIEKVLAEMHHLGEKWNAEDLSKRTGNGNVQADEISSERIE